jgi:hypothetical protein
MSFDSAKGEYEPVVLWLLYKRKDSSWYCKE